MPSPAHHDALKDKLALAGRILENNGQSDYTRGHISVRLPDDPNLFLMKPQTYGFDEMTRENIVTVDIEGRKVAGDAPRHSEVFIHSEIFRVRPDITSVIHSHPVHATSFAATGLPFRYIGQPSSIFWRGLPMFDGTMALVSDQALGAAVAKALGDHKAVLLRNHGIVTAGNCIEEAVYTALLLEDACRQQLLVEAAGGAKAVFPIEEVRKLGERLTRPDAALTTFDYLGRRLTAR